MASASIEAVLHGFARPCNRCNDSEILQHISLRSFNIECRLCLHMLITMKTMRSVVLFEIESLGAFMWSVPTACMGFRPDGRRMRLLFDSAHSLTQKGKKSRASWQSKLILSSSVLVYQSIRTLRYEDSAILINENHFYPGNAPVDHIMAFHNIVSRVIHSLRRVTEVVAFNPSCVASSQPRLIVCCTGVLTMCVISILAMAMLNYNYNTILGLLFSL